jgi:hypothetical protein
MCISKMVMKVQVVEEISYLKTPSLLFITLQEKLLNHSL